MRALILAAILLLSGPANAGVIYEWVGLGDTPCCHGTLEISDAAISAGHATFSTPTFIYPAEPYAPGDVIRFRFDVMQFGPGSITGQYAIDLIPIDDGLSGSIDAFGLESSIRMQGTADLWTISLYRTDVPGRCHFPQDDCAGQTGRWALAAPQGVGEPPAAFILLAGLALLGLACRARALASTNPNWRSVTNISLGLWAACGDLALHAWRRHEVVSADTTT